MAGQALCLKHKQTSCTNITMRTLVIATHLDDESFGIGGTLIKMTQTPGHVTRVICLCTGRLSNDGISRKKAFEENMQVLGCDYKIYDYQDLTLDQVKYTELVKLIQDEVDTFKPTRVFTNSEMDLHRDHKVIAEATKLACRPMKKCSVVELYQFQIPGSSQWAFDNHHFNVAFDITDFIDQKLEMCSRYITEVKESDSYSPCSLEGIRSYSLTNGSTFGFQYAELARLVYKKV